MTKDPGLMSAEGVDDVWEHLGIAPFLWKGEGVRGASSTWLLAHVTLKLLRRIEALEEKLENANLAE